MKTLFFFLLALTGTLACTQAIGQSDLRKKSFNLDKSGLAIGGYDPVAYFTENKAVKGNKDLAVFYEGALYYFSSQQNKEAFKANPAKYEPQYGGWCAYAMGATGEKVEVDPETFKIRNGKLYLFYHSWTNNTLNKWNKDEPNLLPKADANWTKFFH
ncbi:MAG TPA: YHS domain-containing (seleno)protein [Sediminibacterium sp.]|nr:YHS domain-containing (seleno)protein [Sediminibacterium sp.]